MELEAWGTLEVDLPSEILWDDSARSRLATVPRFFVWNDSPRSGTRRPRSARHWVETWSLRVVSGDLEIPKLTFLLSYALDPRGWKDEVLEAGRDDELFAAVASAFAYHARRAVEPDPLRGYVRVEERGPTLRGRMASFAEQMRRGRGLTLPLEIEYDDFVIDIRENRMVLGDCGVVAAVPKGSRTERGVAAQCASVTRSRR